VQDPGLPGISILYNRNNSIKVMGFQCDCGFYTRGDLKDILAHIRGSHDIDVRLGHSHFAHCNADCCLRNNGHGRRINSYESLLYHLKECHWIEIAEE